MRGEAVAAQPHELRRTPTRSGYYGVIRALARHSCLARRWGLLRHSRLAGRLFFDQRPLGAPGRDHGPGRIRSRVSLRPHRIWGALRGGGSGG